MTDIEIVNVVAAVITSDDKYYVCQRPNHKRHGGLWEFPGGKVNADENYFDAMARELREELALTLVDSAETLFSAQENDSVFCIHFIEAQVTGKPVLNEHQNVKWATLDELLRMKLAPVDSQFIRRIK